MPYDFLINLINGEFKLSNKKNNNVRMPVPVRLGGDLAVITGSDQLRHYTSSTARRHPSTAVLRNGFEFVSN
jgi:hypothetical protein